MDQKKNPYSVHPSLSMVQNIITNMRQKTGRTVDEWLALVKTEGPLDEISRRAWLKERHRLGTNYAWWLAERAEGKGAEDDNPEAYLAAALRVRRGAICRQEGAARPLYDRLLQLSLGSGADAKACPCKTIVPAVPGRMCSRRSSRRRRRGSILALWLAKVTAKISARVIPTGGLEKGDRIRTASGSHRSMTSMTASRAG